ncbi:TonB-dependent receptor [Winogradskyella sp. MIT101101]|uniref:TonB-dependent receptor n=1 Tax=Winogradskyella sp. MIT101101 TaxID=3098297 RepID=UPI00399A63A6
MTRLITGLIMALSCFSYSQDCNYTFLGELDDFHDGSPIVSATIYIKEKDKYMVSDFDGKFKIENLCSGTLTLTISHVGCETKIVSYDINGDTFEKILIEHHVEELDEISVSGNVTRTETKTAQETVIKANTLKKYSSLNLGDALKEVAGVSSINTGNTIVKPMINGMHSSRLLILTNDVRLQDQEWGIEHAPNVDINSASQISVIKGSGALAYGGDAIGGVIVINPERTFLKDTLFGKTVLSGQSNGRGFSLSSSLSKFMKSGWFASVQGSLKRYGDFESPDYILTNTGLKSKGITLRGGKKTFESGFEIYYSYLNNNIGILRAAHTGNGGDLANAINAPEPLIINDFSYDINPPRQEVTHHLFKAEYFKRFKNFGKIDVQYDYQNNRRFEFDIRRGERSSIPAVDLRLQTHTVLADLKLDTNLNRKVNFGLMGRYQDNFANPDTGVRRLIPDYDKYDFGVYVTSEWNLTDDLIFDFGARYDFNRIDAKKFYITSRWEERGYDEDFANIVIDDVGTQLLTNPVFNYHNFSASAGLKHVINTKSYVLGNYSLSSRPPNPSELFSDGLHHAAARFEFGDLRISKEISNRISSTYSYNGTDVSFLIDAYFNTINNFIYLRPSGESEITNRGEFVAWEFVQSKAQIFGVDISAVYNISDNFSLNNKTSFIKGYDKTDDIPLIDMPPFSTLNGLTYTNDNWSNFKFNLKSEWVFDQNEYPDFNFEIFDPTRNEDVLLDISTPPKAYHLLHLYSEITVDTSDKTNLNIALSVNNVLDTNYRAYLNRLRYFADDLGRNIMLQLQFNY